MDENRCAICGWPLAASINNGCVRGNCSYRPEPPLTPEQYYDVERASREYGYDFTKRMKPSVAVPGRAVTQERIDEIFRAIEEADQKAIKSEDEKTGFVSFYTFASGVWHKVLALSRQLPASDKAMLETIYQIPGQAGEDAVERVAEALRSAYRVIPHNVVDWDAMARVAVVEMRGVLARWERLLTEACAGSQPSSGHDVCDEVCGLFRVTRDQRDQAWKELAEVRAELAEHKECMGRKEVEALLATKLPCGHPEACAIMHDPQGARMSCGWCEEKKRAERAEADHLLLCRRAQRALSFAWGDARDDATAAYNELRREAERQAGP